MRLDVPVWRLLGWLTRAERHAMPLWLLAGGLASLALGVDRNWDLQNYHLINPLALLGGRGGDIAPAGMQSFFNPAADLPFLLLFLLLNHWPRLLCFLLGLPAGLSGWLLWRLARRMLPPGRALLAALLGVGGAGFVSEIGTTYNDLLTLPLLLGALLALLRGTASGAIWAGLLGGVAVGLKLTNAPFALGLAAAALALPGGVRLLPRLALAGLGGGLLAAGPWMLLMWRDYGNPLFPFADAWFASPGEAARIGRDMRFLPAGAWQAVSWPFRWAVSSEPLVSEIALRDPRMALGLLALPWLGWQAVKAAPDRPAPATLATATFFAVGFLAWYAVFGIYRYALAPEAVAVLLVLAALPARRWWPVVAVAVLCLALTRVPQWGRAPYGAAFLEAALPDLPPGATLLLGGEPAGYLAAVRPDLRLVQLEGLEELGRPSRHLGRLRATLAEGAPAYLLARDPAQAASRFNLGVDAPEPAQCRHLCTNWTGGGVGPAICPLGAAPVPTYRGAAGNALCGMAGGGFGGSGRRGLALPAEGGTLHLPEGCGELWLRTNPGGAAMVRGPVPVEVHRPDLVRLAPPAGLEALRLDPAPGLLLRAARCGAPPA